MRVGVYLGDFAPEEGGGHGFVSTVLDGLLAAAASSEHRFVALCEPGQARVLGERMAAAGVEHCELGGRTSAGMAIAALRHYSPLAYLLRKFPDRVERAARRRGVELVWFVPGLAYDAIDIPYIGTIWDLQHRLHPWFPEVGAAGYWEHRELTYARFVRRAAHLVTGTQVGAGQLHALYGVPLERISVLPQPAPRIDSVQGAPSPGVAGLAGERFFFYPAQFWAHKNHVNLLRALALLDADVGLVFTGADKGTRRHVERAAAELGLAGRVRFAGFVSVAEVAWLYRHALGLVYPSFNGPDNLPPLEAFVLGCPVAMSDYPGAQEQAGDAALVFNPRDPESIARQMRALCDDALLRQELVQRGRARVATRTGAQYVRGVLAVVDAFSAVRRCWD